MNELRFCLPLLALVSVAISGCFQNDGLNLTPVSGKVTLEGEPLSGVMVCFYPIGDGISSMGRTDAEGRYELRFTSDKDGVVPGEYSVQIVTPVDDNTGKAIGPQIPKRYHSDSTLTATIDGSQSVFDFDLSSK